MHSESSFRLLKFTLDSGHAGLLSNSKIMLFDKAFAAVVVSLISCHMAIGHGYLEVPPARSTVAFNVRVRLDAV